MMGLPRIEVLEWAARAPGLAGKERWLEFLKAARPLPRGEPLPAENVPSRLRRRMGPLSRLAVEAGLACCQEAGIPAHDIPSVFASRHGELSLIADLLRRMSEGEELSPAVFTNAVHHAPAGYFSIVAKNRLAARTVAGGEASFCYGLLDAMGLLAEDADRPVLLVAADSEMPEPFGSMVEGSDAEFAVALILRSCREGGGIAMELGPSDGGCAGGIPAVEFLRWYLSESSELRLRASGRCWRWTR